MVYHEVNHDEHLISHLILFSLLKLHHTFCALEKFETKIFQSNKSA